MKIWPIIRNTDKHFSILILWLLVLMIVIGVLMRNVFSAPLIGLDEICGYFLIWIIFVTSPYTARSGGHLRVEEFQALLPKRTRYVVQLLSHIFTMIIFGIIAASSIITTLNNRGTLLTTLEIPFPIFFVPIVAGLSLLTLEYVIQLIHFLRNSKSVENK